MKSKVKFSKQVLKVDKLKNIYGGKMAAYTGPTATIYGSGADPTKDAEGSDKD